MADNRFGNIAAIQKSFVEEGHGQGFHVAAHARHQGEPPAEELLGQFLPDITLVAKQSADEVFGQLRHRSRVADVARGQLKGNNLALMIEHQMPLDAENQPILVFPRAARPSKTLCLAIRRVWHTGKGVLSMS